MPEECLYPLDGNSHADKPDQSNYVAIQSISPPFSEIQEDLSSLLEKTVYWLNKFKEENDSIVNLPKIRKKISTPRRRKRKSSGLLKF